MWQQPLEQLCDKENEKVYERLLYISPQSIPYFTTTTEHHEKKVHTGVAYPRVNMKTCCNR